MENEYIKEQKIKEITQNQKDEELINSALKAKNDLDIALNNYEFAEGNLIDYFSYQIKANQSKLNYLLVKIKKRGLLLDPSKKLELKNKNII